METRYTELFRIECRHDYFADHRCRVLTLSPTEACRLLLKRYRCRFRPSPGGGAVYYGAYDGETLLPLFQEQTPFAFTLTSSDPMLSTYTEIDDGGESPAQTLYYFDNLTTPVGDVSGEKPVLLHPPDAPVQALPVKAPAFRHTFAKPRRGKVLRVLDVPGGREVWKGPAPPELFRSCALDLARLSPGRYEFHLDKKKVLDFYLSDMPAARQWGVVEIFARAPGLAVPAPCRVIDAAGLATPRTFTLSLATRQTFWRYYIVSQSPERKYNDYQIVGGPSKLAKLAKPAKPAKPVAFTDPKPESVAGKDAWVFESKTGIPLYEVPTGQHEFTLVAKGAEPKRRRSIKLPYAQSKTTRLDGESKPPRMCSEIYVYL